MITSTQRRLKSWRQGETLSLVMRMMIWNRTTGWSAQLGSSTSWSSSRAKISRQSTQLEDNPVKT